MNIALDMYILLFIIVNVCLFPCPGGSSGSGGMIVGAVINKPVEVVPAAVPSAVQTPMMQAQLPPGKRLPLHSDTCT